VPDIVTVTINPAIDIFVNTLRVKPTSKLRCSAPKRDPGGGGINVARVVHRLGGDVAAIYPIGGAIGRLLHRLVEREGIDSIVTPTHVETRENFTAFEEETGEQYRFVLPGSPLHRPEWEAVLDKLATLPQKPRFVVASGSVPPGVPDDIYANIARIARSLGARMVIDTSGAALRAALEVPEVAQRLATDGAETAWSTPTAYAADIAAEEAKWSPIVRKAGIRAE